MNLYLTEEDVRAIESGAESAMRQGDSDTWLRLSSLALKCHAQRVFACNVDESAGMAEVVDLHGYSKRVPCA